MVSVFFSDTVRSAVNMKQTIVFRCLHFMCGLLYIPVYCTQKNMCKRHTALFAIVFASLILAQFPRRYLCSYTADRPRYDRLPDILFTPDILSVVAVFARDAQPSPPRPHRTRRTPRLYP